MLILASNLMISAKEKSYFNLQTLDGEWKGIGKVIIPGTSMKISVEGNAIFDYMTEEKYLRTSITAEKFMMTYKDSGKMVFDEKTNILIWEIWDNSNRYAKYVGKYENDIITTKRLHKKKIMEATLEIKSADTILFFLRETIKKEADAKTIDRAVITFVRVKPVK